MQGLRRKIVYVTLFEAIAIAVTSNGLSAGSGSSLEHAGVAAVASSVIAVLWNLAYNTAFEHWEARQTVRGRSFQRRAVHAIGFEIGLSLCLIPLFIWWLQIGLWQALLLDIGLSLFFVVYAFLFNLAFDKLFGLPLSAQ